MRTDRIMIIVENATTGMTHVRIFEIDSTTRAKRNMLQYLRYHGAIKPGDKYTIEAWTA